MSVTAKPNIGRKIFRIRELKGMKQETLAGLLGISQQAVSRIESSEEIDEARLQEIATALGVTAEAIHHFSEEAMINHMNSIHSNNDGSVNAVVYYQLSPVDKITELYERLLASEKEKNAMLEALLKKYEK